MQPGYPGAPQPTAAPAKKKSSVGKIIGGCLGAVVLSCCCFTGIGGYVGYLENRGLYTLGDEVSTVPFQLGVPQQVTAVGPGSGYAFAQIWAEIDAQQVMGGDMIMTGQVSCRSGFADDVDIMVWEQNARVTDFTRSGDHVTAKVMVHDEYMRSGEAPQPCTVNLQLRGATLTSGNLVVRTYQRPSDRFAN